MAQDVHREARFKGSAEVRAFGADLACATPHAVREVRDGLEAARNALQALGGRLDGVNEGAGAETLQRLIEEVNTLTGVANAVYYGEAQ